MGAETFSQVAQGANAKEAFKAARDEALYDHGHAGYTGTIAEKSDFVMLDVSDELRTELSQRPYYDYDGDDPLWDKVNDKWGPAGCIDLKNGKFLFFGWASS